MATLPTLLTLPSELMETILICSRSPRTVAATAQTCRTLRTLVYASPDSHLWRELFLTTWDDPRPAHEHRALVDPRIDLTVWDWGIEYRRRVTAEKQLKAWRQRICLSVDDDEETSEEWDAATLPALQAILDTLLTLRPLPSSPPIALTVLTPTISPYPTGNVGSGIERRERMTSAPPLPPLLILLAIGSSTFQRSRSAARMGRMVYGPYTSRTIDGTEVIPTPSLPPQLVRTLMASHRVEVKGVPAHVPFLCGAEYWSGDVVGDLFHRIICITGFVAIPPPLPPAAPARVPVAATNPTPTPTPNPSISASGSEDTEASNDGKDLETEAKAEEAHQTEPAKPQSPPKPRITKPFPTPSQQHDDARILARRRVYDMRYLRGDRLWGPFQAVTRESLSSLPGTGISSARRSKDKGTGTSGATPTARRTHGLGTLAWAMGVDVEVGEHDSSSDDDDDDDDDDEDWLDETAEDAGTSATMEDPMNVDAEPEVEDEPVHPLISFILATRSANESDTNATSTNSSSSRRRTRPNPRLPPNAVVSPREIKAHHLKPDYTYLASVRIAVEANLRELSGSDIDNIVGQSASEARPGGVGMFWEDEDEILRARAVGAAVPSEPASSSNVDIASETSGPRTPSPTTPTLSSSGPRSFELADILSHFQGLDVARIGSACGYWSGWVERKASTSTPAPGSVNTEVDASSSSAAREGGIGTRKPRIVSQRTDLEGKPDVRDEDRDKREGGGKSEGTGKGKGKEAESGGAGGSEPMLGDWEVGPEGEACEGWDWAAVAGIWRRCVCWMDYRELLFFNLDSSKFLSLDTQEACRIIPMELHITGYTRSGLFPIYDTEPEFASSPSKSSTPAPTDTDAETTGPNPKRHKTSQAPCTRYFRPPPVIHFVGSSVGSDRGLDDGRTVRGSVQLIGGGEVRWQMDTYVQESSSPGSSTPEWSSEAVQVGGIGSAVGLLGMWTGAGHERADPLGPFWAWRVA